ncbi:hypothetical protein LZ30DRAFT_742401 [Colletotrichum cereale]|nr:hypothetical protein LZ30DRAFT_742401 [Colletotrichum cereale]
MTWSPTSVFACIRMLFYDSVDPYYRQARERDCPLFVHCYFDWTADDASSPSASSFDPARIAVALRSLL